MATSPSNGDGASVATKHPLLLSSIAFSLFLERSLSLSGARQRRRRSPSRRRPFLPSLSSLLLPVLPLSDFFPLSVCVWSEDDGVCRVSEGDWVRLNFLPLLFIFNVYFWGI